MERKMGIVCREIIYQEFPELVFGLSEEGINYFDATAYILHKGNSKINNIPDFKNSFNFWISALCTEYTIQSRNVIITNELDGHILIDDSLALLFLSYVDPQFGVYMLERIHEMLITGIAISDSLLLLKAKERFSSQDIK